MLCHTTVTRMNKMASIRKRNHKWQAQVRRGQHASVSKTFIKKHDALEWARLMEIKADRNELSDHQSLGELTLKQLIARYINEYVDSKRSSRNENYALQKFMRHSFTAKYLSNISPEDFEKYKRYRLQHVKPSTFRREMNIVRHAYNIAIKVWRLPIKSNPLDAVSMPSTSGGRSLRIDPDNLDGILLNAKQSRNKSIHDIIVFALETAMRRGEIVNIKRCDYDLDKATLNIPLSKNGYSRTIPLSKNAVEVLQRRKFQLRPFPVSAPAVSKCWETIRRNANVPELNFHDLRHEAISRFFERGLSIPEVALISGHRDYRMLYRYTHLRAEDIVKKLQ